jgi:small subunit ribosomal protein S20
MAEEKKAEKKTRRPTPLKRELQNQRKRLANRSFRASVSTAVRSLQDSLTEKAPSKEKLDLIYSLVDKAVKRGIFKPNKASRLKSRLTARAQNA